MHTATLNQRSMLSFVMIVVDRSPVDFVVAQNLSVYGLQGEKTHKDKCLFCEYHDKHVKNTLFIMIVHIWLKCINGNHY